MNVEETTLLQRCHLFSSLSSEQIYTFFSKNPYLVRTVSRASHVASRGDKYTSLIIILKGELNAHFQDLEGKTLKLETLKAPEAVASAILFSENQELPVNLEAATDCLLFQISRKVLLDLFMTFKPMLLGYLQDNGNKLSFLAEKIRFLQFSTIKGKIAFYLLDKQSKSGKDNLLIPLSMSKEIMAELFGVTRPALSRVFIQMQNEKIIKTEKKAVRILDLAALKNLLE